MSEDKTKNRFQRFARAFIFAGLFAGLINSIYWITTSPHTLSGIRFLERFFFWPAGVFLSVGFCWLVVKTMFYVIYRKEIPQLCYLSLSDETGSCERLYIKIYVFILSVTVFLGAYFVATQIVFLVTGHTYSALQHR